MVNAYSFYLRTATNPNPQSELNLATKTGTTLQDAHHSKFRTNSPMARHKNTSANAGVFLLLVELMCKVPIEFNNSILGLDKQVTFPHPTH